MTSKTPMRNTHYNLASIHDIFFSINDIWATLGKVSGHNQCVNDGDGDYP